MSGLPMGRHDLRRIEAKNETWVVPVTETLIIWQRGAG